MMIIKILLGNIFAWFRYRKKNDAFKEFEKFKELDKVVKSEKRVLVLPINVSPTSSLFEGLYSEYMSLKGAKVYALFENSELNYSEYSNVTKNNFITKCLSLYEQKRFASCFNVKPINYMSKYNFSIDKNKKLDELLSLKYKGIDVGLHAKFGVMRYLMISKIKEADKPLLIEFLVTAMKTVDSVNNAILISKPDVSLISHGCYSTWGVALDVLKMSGIKTSVWGRGYVGKGSIIISPDESYLSSRMKKNNSEWDHLDLTEKDKNKLLKYYSDKKIPDKEVDFVSYYTSTKKDSLILEALKEKSSKFKKTIGVYPNIPWDGTMYSSSEAFPDASSFAKLIYVAAKEKTSYHFLIRCHPAETARKGNLSQESFKDLLDGLAINDLPNVTIIESNSSVTSYDVKNISDCALMYGSTLALEFLIDRHPVIQLGRSNVSNKGLLLEPISIKDALECLDRAEVMTDAQFDNVLRYAYYWIYLYHIEDTLIDLDCLSFQKFKFKSKYELLESEMMEKIDGLINH